MPFGIGPLELIIVLVIILVIFGPKRLPGVGRSLGQGMREFKDSISGKDKGEDKGEDDERRDLPAGEEEPAERPPAATSAGTDDAAARAFGRDD
jgi:sec-independent protein translocase protein TatA